MDLCGTSGGGGLVREAQREQESASTAGDSDVTLRVEGYKEEGERMRRRWKRGTLILCNSNTHTGQASGRLVPGFCQVRKELEKTGR